MLVFTIPEVPPQIHAIRMEATTELIARRSIAEPDK